MDGCLVFVPWPGMMMGERKIGYNRSCRIPDDTIDRLHCDRLIVLLLRGLGPSFANYHQCQFGEASQGCHFIGRATNVAHVEQ